MEEKKPYYQKEKEDDRTLLRKKLRDFLLNTIKNIPRIEDTKFGYTLYSYVKCILNESNNNDSKQLAIHLVKTSKYYIL